jgi:ATP-dependent RNA helicase DDX60
MYVQSIFDSILSLTEHQLKTGAPKKGKAQQLTSKERILQSIQKEKKMKEDDSSSTWWHQRLSGLDKMSVRERIEGLQSLFRNKHAQDGWLSLEIHLYRLHLEILKWVEDPAREEPKVRDAYCIWLVRSITELCGRKRMSSIVFTCFETVLHALGFGNYIESLKSTVAFDSSLDRPLSFNFVKVVGSKTKSPLYKFMSITENPITWQLRLFGEYMDRSMDSQSDTRVHFEPDGWQREVLDCLDTDKSVLVVG